MPCSRHWPTAHRPSMAIRPAATADRPSSACATLGVSIEETGRTPEGLSLRIARPRPGRAAHACIVARCREFRQHDANAGGCPDRPSLRLDDDRGRVADRVGPCSRVIVPLERMGARIASNDGRPPLTIAGLSLPDAHRLRAGGAERAGQERGPAGRDSIRRGSPGSVRPSPRGIIRNGRLPRSASTSVREAQGVSVRGGQRLTAQQLAVPGDMSSAAFWMVAAASLSGSEIVIDHVGLNPSRTGIIDILRRMGAVVSIEARTTGVPVSRSGP